MKRALALIALVSGAAMGQALPQSSSSGGGSSTSYGAYASRPSAGSKGRVYIASDSPIALWADDGSVWHPLLEGQVVGTQPKAAASFSAFNNGSSVTTLTDASGTLRYSYPTDGASTTVRGWVESVSSTTMHVEAVISSSSVTTNTTSYPAYGIVMRESGTGKLLIVNSVQYGSPFGDYAIEVGVWSSATSRTSNTAYTVQSGNGPLFLKLVRATTSIQPQVSRDGSNWTNVGTAINVTTAFTTAPDQVGFAGIAWLNTDSVFFAVEHYLSGT